MTTEHFNKIVNIAKIFKFEPGQVIFHEGDKEDYLYVVVEGRVAIEITVPGRGRDWYSRLRMQWTKSVGRV